MGYFRLVIKRIIWRNKNKHNSTKMNNDFDTSLISVGKYTYGLLTVHNYSEERCVCKIGNFCSIADDVVFLVGDDHEVKNISTFPFKVKIKGENMEAKSRGDIIVNDDVWIGQRAIILSGVHIGQGAVIAAGAVVNKNVPPYAIVGGVPAKVIKYRFTEEMIDELLKIDYSKLTKNLIVEHIDEMYRELKHKNQLDWIKKI